jgi:hypothetical protein
MWAFLPNNGSQKDAVESTRSANIDRQANECIAALSKGDFCSAANSSRRVLLWVNRAILRHLNHVGFASHRVQNCDRKKHCAGKECPAWSVIPPISTDPYAARSYALCQFRTHAALQVEDERPAKRPVRDPSTLLTSGRSVRCWRSWIAMI